MSVGALILRMALALCFGIVVAISAFVWIPSANRWINGFYLSSTYSPEYNSTFVGTSYSDYSYTPAVDAIKEAADEYDVAALNDIHADLIGMDEEQLYKAKGFWNICLGGQIDCRELPDSKVRMMVEAVLDDRRSARDRAIIEQGRDANTILFWTMIVAALAFALSVFNFTLGILNFTQKRPAENISHSESRQ